MSFDVNHTVESPFPKDLPNGQTVIDERCTCGTLRSEHEDTFSYGHGANPYNNCQKFSFDGFVFEK